MESLFFYGTKISIIPNAATADPTKMRFTQNAPI